MHRRLPAESDSKREVGWRDPLARYEAREPLAIPTNRPLVLGHKGVCVNGRKRLARLLVQVKLALGLSFTHASVYLCRLRSKSCGCLVVPEVTPAATVQSLSQTRSALQCGE